MGLLRIVQNYGLRPRSLAKRSMHGRRLMHPDNRFFKVSDEVRDAVLAGEPVVALETAIYTHAKTGFPYPDNVALASRLEAVVRKHGGVPAHTGVIDGVARVGIRGDELERLAYSASHGKETTLKVSRRDLGFICGMGRAGQLLNGGTTVAGTMVLAHLAGIKVFATGGLGGVHRNGENTMDISADLTELGRTPVAVISSGCKSFLDIKLTLEYLETQGVCVATFAGGREGDVDFPAFWTRESGIKSPHIINTAREAAAIIYAQNLLSIGSGQLFANPIPNEHSIPLEDMRLVIKEAIRSAKKHDATGKDETPFILKKINQFTDGNSLNANRALVESNVIMGTNVAVELTKLERGRKGLRRDSIPKKLIREPESLATNPSSPLAMHQMPVSRKEVDAIKESQPSPSQKAVIDQVDILVAGSMAIDLSCDFSPLRSSSPEVPVLPHLHTSNPAVITQSLGGVALNITRAAYLCGASSRLCSLVGNDLGGRAALDMLQQLGLQTSGVKTLDKGAGTGTAHYVAINDTKKDLFLGMADTSILQGQSATFASTWLPEISRARPKWLAVDANWGSTTLYKWISLGKAAGARVAFEPVGAAKSARLFPHTRHGIMHLDCFPNHSISLATPNTLELSAMHTAARDTGALERQDWWRIIDAIGIHGDARDRLIALTNTVLVDEGVPQQSIQLLPFIPCILTKLGPKGVLLTRLLEAGDERLTDPDSAPYILSRSDQENSGVGGVYMRLFSAAEEVPQEEVVSVTGVGDTFLGVLLAGLARGGKKIEELVDIAQRGSVLTLKSREAVSPKLGELRRELDGDDESLS